MKDNQGKRNIHSQIMKGYLKIIAIIILVGISICAIMMMIGSNYMKLVNNDENKSAMQSSIVSHYEWLNSLNSSIQTGDEFTGSLDPTLCSFGKWLQSTEDMPKNAVIEDALTKAKKPHNELHNSVTGILELSKTDKMAAFNKYTNEIQPKTVEVIGQLDIVYEEYASSTEDALKQLQQIIVIAIILVIFTTIIITIFGILYARKTANKISEPMVIVSEWAKELSLGADDLDLDNLDIEKDSLSEVHTLIEAFKGMNENIKQNISVMKRLSAGDMTTFVDIRSNKDTLGKNIYQMVQTNNMVFNEILEVANTVAMGSVEISNSSDNIAKTATEQAGSVQMLSWTIKEARTSFRKSSEQTIIAEQTANNIARIATESNEKMKVLLESVLKIADSSAQVSTIIKTIDSIAFKTNILALNANVEAARAGTAGKGFAVVAEEVRNLAIQSSEAVKISEELIQDTIGKSTEGKEKAIEVSEVFASVISEINTIVDIIQNLSTFAEQQQLGIQEIDKGIIVISDAAQENAAISEEAANTSEAISNHAEKLQKVVKSFKLRDNSENGAYIAPEKKNDLEYIKIANEIYNLAIKNGNFANPHITSN